MAKQQGPSKSEINEIKNSLKELEQLYTRLGGINPFKGMDPKLIASSSDEVKRLKNTLQDARDAVSDMDGEVGDLFKSWRAITDEVKGHRKNINDAKGTVSKINDLIQKLKDHQTKINTLSSKDLNNIKSKLEQQKAILKTNRDTLQNTIAELSIKKQLGTATAHELAQLREAEIIQRNIVGGLDEENGLLDNIIDKAQQEAKARKDIETGLGVTGGILKGISQIPILKDLVDTEKILNDANKEIELTGSGLKGLVAGFKSMGDQIKSGLFNPANLALKFINQMASALKLVDTGAGDLAKNFNITYSEALNVRRELGNMAAMSGDVALNTKNLQETLTFVGGQLGSNAKLNEGDLKTFTKLREQAGYTNEELYGIQQLSLVNNKTLEDNTKEILGGAKAYASRNKLVINEKQVLRDVSKASASIKLSLGGSAEAVAEAAVKARQFGVSLEQAEKISQSLLNFESSIENELSAELLLGKDLNFEKARQLALNNDIAGATEEIAKQVGTSADFANMNAIQQEAIAKSAGMTRDELAQSLMDREALAKLSGVEGANAQERFNNLVKEVGMEEAKKRLGNEQLANQYQQQSVQERFAQATEKLQEIFIQIAEPILAIVSPLMDLVGIILPAANMLLQPLIVGFQTISDSLSGLFGFLTGSNKELSVMQGIIGAIAAGYLLYQGYVISTNVYQGISAALSKEKLVAENASRAAMVAQKVAAVAFLPIQTAIALIAGTKAIAEVTAAEAATLGLATIAIIGGLAMVVGAMSSSKSKVNDGVFPAVGGSGYGKRTLFGPEGAIQLNNKDTVIAGTNLFDKGDDVVPGPKGAISVSNSTSPKKETPMDPNSGTNARLDALITATTKVNSISTLKIQ
jgi:archaellum component FlaC